VVNQDTISKSLARWLVFVAFTCGLLVGLIVGVDAGLTIAHAESGERVYTATDTLIAIDQYSAEFHVPHDWLLALISCETGGTFDPYSVGKQGELGAAQLHPRGELVRFYAWGYLDPYSPYQAIRFAAQEYGYGRAWQWSCA
jgi:hypothetical protein